MKILLTGSGSLIARGIHDALSGRNDGLDIVGANLDTKDPTAMRCERVHPLPPDSNRTALRDALMEIVEMEQPDLVIPCRDPHIPILAEIRDREPLVGRVLVGPPHLATLMVDKWDAHQWSVARGIPFAPTVLADDCPNDAIEAMIEEFGYPLIAKPRDGSGSLGVRLVHNREQLDRSLALCGTVVQPFLDPADPESTRLDTTLGTPLFWEIPVTHNYAGQFLIDPTGKVGPSMQMYASQRLGRNEYLARWEDDVLQEMMETTVEALAKEGWRGPVNVQARPHHGHWFITEFGGRFSGGTSQRTWLGFDEVGWTLNQWAGDEVVPPLIQPPAQEVYRYLTDCPIWHASDGPSITPP